MLSSDPAQWRIFNILLRLLGIGATFAGSVAVISFGLGLPAPPEATRVLNWPSIVTGGMVALLGLGFLMNPAFRPDLGDTHAVPNLFRGQRRGQRRTWWTGDPVT
jgi:hypothetical protein